MQALSRRFRAVRRRAGGPLRDVSEADLRRWCPADPHVRTRDLVRRLRWTAHPRLYLAQLPSGERAALGVAPSVDDTLRHYLAVGAGRGLRLSALFSPDWYAEALAGRGLADGGLADGGPAGQRPTDLRADGAALFFHWLTAGWERRIVPTPLFDADWYAARHPRLAAVLRRSGRWGFEHYLAEGCYDPAWIPSPLGRHEPGGERRRDPAAGDPLLMRELLHRGDAYDLTRTSWLEDGQRVGLRRLASLESSRMRELIARATDLDPAVRHTGPTPFITVPPYRTRRLYLAEQAEAVRRAVGVAHADLVILVACLDDGPVTPYAELVDAPRPARRPGAASWLIIGTDLPAARPSGDGRFDLAPYAEGLAPEQRIDLLVDLLRGLGPSRVVLVDSVDGRLAARAYGRQFRALFRLGRLDRHVGTSEVAWDAESEGRS